MRENTRLGTRTAPATKMLTPRIKMHSWDAGQYLRFSDQRTLPAVDLLSRVRLTAAPRRIIDLGCGPGNSTALLQQRWPDAAITGLDSSKDMLAAGRRDHKGIDFVSGDLSQWTPESRFDLVFSNAALQWIGDHARLLPRLLTAVTQSGALAVQMPRNHDSVTHAVMREAAADQRWRERLAGARDPSPVRSPEFYYDLLAPLSDELTIWETNYLTIMENVSAIIAWLRGTGLRPFLSRLNVSEQTRFLDHYAELLGRAFPVRADGRILLPYPRLFFVATPRRSR